MTRNARRQRFDDDDVAILWAVLLGVSIWIAMLGGAQ